MHIFITGATGFVGGKLAHKLLEQGHTLYGLSRSPEKSSKLFNGKIKFYQWGDQNSFEVPKEVIEKCEGVIHLAGESVAQKRWTKEVKEEIKLSRGGATKNLVNIFKNSPSLKFFISASAIGIYGDQGDKVLTESAPMGADFLSEVCNEWEGTLFHSELSCRKVALRIGLVLGKNGGALKKILPPFKLGLGGNLGSGRQWMSWIHVNDLVELVLYSIKNENISGAVNAVTVHCVRNKEFTKILAKTLRRPAFFHAPAIALKMALGEMSQILLGSQRVAPQVLEKLGFTYQYPTLEKALNEIIKGTK